MVKLIQEDDQSYKSDYLERNKNMAKDSVKTEINVIDNKIGIMRIGDVEYISLTDLARYADAEEPRLPIRDWMRNKEVISYLGLQESMNNKNFKGGEFAIKRI